MIRLVLFLFLLLLVLPHNSDCAKILGVVAAPAASHYRLSSTLMRALAEKGHDVTVISCYGEKDPPKNGTYRDIVVTEVHEAFLKIQNSGGFFEREGTNPLISTALVGRMTINYMNKALENKDVQKLIHSDEKFDVVIVEQFMNEAHKALAKHFNAPLIVFSTFGPNYWINPSVGNPSPLSYIPDLMIGYSTRMTFFERVINTVIYLFNEAFYNFYVLPKQNSIIKKYIPNGPDIKDVYYNVSLILMNTHASMAQPVPKVPNMVEIGGFHIKPPKKLPQDLQEYLDNFKDGVIYFSMGSNLKSSLLPPEKRDAFLKAFAKLKQNVLWKWEEDILPGQPKNVKLAKWLPQQDILAHPNVKLFITHGGLLSTTETIYHGIPILAIPIFGDQKMNAQTAVNNGFGLILLYREISEEKLTRNINEILNNPKYKDNAKKYSKIFHDRQVHPMETAIYWVEYVIRHQGAPHLRVAGLDLPWYRYFLVDVMVFLATISLTIMYITYSVGKIICKRIRSKNKSKKIKSK